VEATISCLYGGHLGKSEPVVQPATAQKRVAMVEETLAEYIRRLCKERGLSWRQASIRAGLDPTYISALLRGRHPEPKAETLKALATALGGDYTYMLALRNLAPDQEKRKKTLLEQQIIDRIKHLPPSDQERIIAMIDGLAAYRRKQQTKAANESPSQILHSKPPTSGPLHPGNLR
jgi:transcriptional regulator with XRE-family HTH domain